MKFSPNVKVYHKELARETLSELKYDNIKEQLKKIFSDTKSELFIKAESPDASPTYSQKANSNR